MSAPSTDIAILGGGLSGGLLALALHARRPGLHVTVFEQGEQCGGDHVWSFFGTDIEERADLLAPLIAASWNGYDVRFPKRRRTLNTPYQSVTSERLDAALRATLPEGRLITGATVTRVTPHAVTLADGRRFSAGAVIDARGAKGFPHMAGGWQKFTGQMLRLSAPHGLIRPIVMDATVAQHDGYRFVYSLPFSATEVFVEDTYYADGPTLDAPAMRQRIADYAAAQGWHVASIAYEETGVLPVIATGDFDAFWKVMGQPGLGRAGARAGMVHPLTSYSLPIAWRFALHLSTLDNFSAQAIEQACHAYAREHWRQGRFYRMLTRMLYGAAEPDLRYKILERFYGLPEPLIERFYAGQSTPADALRVLAGKPPVPLIAAMASLAGRGRPLAPLGATT